MSGDYGVRIVENPISPDILKAIAAEQFGDLVKAVVDVEREVMAIGGELHADEEAALIADGSRQEHLWGINIYPARRNGERIEFDSMINVRPSQGNASRDVEDAATRARILAVIGELVT